MDTVLMFRFAKLYNFYHHQAAIALRAVFLLIISVSILYSLQQGLPVRFVTSLLLLFLMVELFMKMKLTSLKPKKTVKEAQPADVYETMTLSATATALKLPNVRSFLTSLKGRSEVRFVLTRAGINPNEVLAEALDTGELALLAFKLAQEAEEPYITALDILGAYLLITENETKLLFQKELKKDDLSALIAFAKHIYPQELMVSLPKVKLWGAGIGEAWVAGWTIETQKYTRDFTKQSLAYPTVSGRQSELCQLIEILTKSKRTNALLIGPPGVGKKSIVAAFATQSFLGDIAEELRFLRVLELLSGSLVAGAASAGELEERLNTLLAEVSHAGDVVLFIPEVQNIAGAGSDALDVTGVLLPHLVGERRRVIATVTPQNYKTFLEKKHEFLEAFETITVHEPSKEEAIPMLLDASISLAKRHGATFNYKAIVATIELSKKYMPDRVLPGKAITLLDEVGARARLSGKSAIGQDDIVLLVEEKVPVKISKPKQEEKELLLGLEDVLHKRIIDQDEAVRTVSEAMRRLRAGLSFEGRPVGVFLFLGPTGVGKTETAKALASVYFGSDEAHSASSGQAMVRFDMAEYQDRAMAERLISELTDKIRAKPFSLILLDEFEKAYFSLLDLFLSVFEDGRLTDSMGRTVSFDNTIIIATSNAGSELIREGIQSGIDLVRIKPQLLDMLQREGIFKPELLNRFDAVVLFKPLGEKEIEQVTELLLQKVAEVLVKRDITFTFDKKAIAKIAKEGFDETMGARPLRRFIQDHVEDLLSKKLLRDEVKRGDTIILSTDNTGNLTLTVSA